MLLSIGFLKYGLAVLLPDIDITMRRQKLKYWLYRARNIHPLPVIILSLFLLVYLLHHYPFPTYENPVYINSIKPMSKRASIPYQHPEPQTITKDLVLAATTSSNLDWLSQIDQEAWTPYIYIANATASDVSPTKHTYTVPMNKGNEAMAYLTHIIDNYDNLADVTLFHHDHYASWHQTLPSPVELNLLHPSYVIREGYVSTRCSTSSTHTCSDLETIKLSSTIISLKRLSRSETRAARIPSMLVHFLGKEEAKRIMGDGMGRILKAPCCAMFAVSREAVHRRDIEIWRGLREWLIETSLDSWAAGRIFEWTWHVWFGMDGVL